MHLKLASLFCFVLWKLSCDWQSRLAPFYLLNTFSLHIKKKTNSSFIIPIYPPNSWMSFLLLLQTLISMPTKKSRFNNIAYSCEEHSTTSNPSKSSCNMYSLFMREDWLIEIYSLDLTIFCILNNNNQCTRNKVVIAVLKNSNKIHC